MPSIKTITLLGATGYIGRRLVPQLARKGMILRLPVRDLRQAARFKMMGKTGQIAYFPISLRNEAALAAAMDGSDIVINLIGIRKETLPGQFQALHVEMAARLARLAYQKGVKRLIHVSSFAADLQGRTPYARTKGASEEAVLAFFGEATLLRPHPLFGEGDRLLTPFSRMARFSRILSLPHGEKPRLRPAFVEDVVQAILAAIELPESRGKIYDLAGPDLLDLQSIGEMVFRQAGRNPRTLHLPPWAVRLWGTSFREFGAGIGTPSAEKSLHPFQALGLQPRSMEEVLQRLWGDEKALSQGMKFEL